MTQVDYAKVHRAQTAVARRREPLPFDALGITGHAYRLRLEALDVEPPGPTPPAHDYGPHVASTELRFVEVKIRHHVHKYPLDPALEDQRARVNTIAHQAAQEAHR